MFLASAVMFSFTGCNKTETCNCSKTESKAEKVYTKEELKKDPELVKKIIDECLNDMSTTEYMNSVNCARAEGVMRARK